MTSCPPPLPTQPTPEDLTVPGAVTTPSQPRPTQTQAQAAGGAPGLTARAERLIPVISYLPVVLRIPLSLMEEFHPEWPVKVTYGSYLNVEVPREVVSPSHRPSTVSLPTPRLLLSVTERSLGIGFEGYPAGGPAQLHSSGGYIVAGVMREGQMEPLPSRP